MNTSEKVALVRSFSASSAVSAKLICSSDKI